MFKRTSGLVATLIVACAASGCAAPLDLPVEQVIRQGVVEQVTEVPLRAQAMSAWVPSSAG